MSDKVKKIVGVGLIIGASFLGGAPGALLAFRLVGAALLGSASKPKNNAKTTNGTELQISGDPVDVRAVVYGEAWTAGTLRYRNTANTDNKDLYMVIVLAGHEIDSVQAVECDREILTLDGSGNVTNPSKWAGLLNVRFYLGTDSQTADSTLDSTFTNWTTDHRLRGLAYAIVKLTFNEENMNTVPAFRFKVRGRKVYDPRLDSTNGGSGSHRLATQSTWAWSRNAVLCYNDFHRGIKVNGINIAGLGLASTRFDWSNVIAEANVCDESVTLAAGGNQKRYTVDGFIDPRQVPADICRHFDMAMAGDSMPADGKWRYFAGAYRTPTLSLTDEHFVGPLRHTVHRGELELYDTAEGRYAALAESGTVVNYSPVRLASATTGSERLYSIDFQLVADSTNSSSYDGGARAQRIAKLLLEKEVAGKTISCTTNLYGLRCVPGETVNVTHAAFGLTSQEMRVLEVQLKTIRDEEGHSGLVVDLTLEAGPSSLYAWSAQETALSPSPTLVQAVVPSTNLNNANISINSNGTLSGAGGGQANLTNLPGTVTTTQIADASLTVAKFASSIEPVTIVSAVPGTKSTSSIFNTTDGKLYRWNGSAYVATVPTTDLSGTVSTAQIANAAITTAKFASSIEPVTIVSAVPETKSTNSIFNTTDGKLYRWNGSAYVATVPTTDLSGTLTTAQIADAALTTAKFAAGIEPVTIVSAVPGTKSTNSIFNTTDGKLYRWNGSAYVATVPTSDLSGTVSDAQIAGLAASKITDTLTDAQLAAIAAAKITGQITTTQITDGAISTPKLAAGSVTAATIAADTITAAQIAAGAITSSELAAGSVVAGKIAAGTIQAADIAAGTITGDRLAANTITASQIATDTITAGQIAAGAINASELAAGAVTTAKLAIIAPGAALNADPGFLDSSAWSDFGGGATFATVTDGKVGNNVARSSGAGVQVWMNETKRIPVDAAKTYRVRCWMRLVSGSGSTAYMGVALFDSSGNNLNGDGTQWLYAASNVQPSSSWTEYTGTFGAGTAKTFPSTARTMSPLFILSYGGGTSVHEIQDLRIEEVLPATLIADGAITTDKVAANAITAAKIAANTITAAQIATDTITAGQIAAGAITASELAAGAVVAGKIAAGTIVAADIAAGTITGDRIASNTITASQIASDTITAGQIAAGAISTSELASGAVTAEKLSVVSFGDGVLLNPGFEDASASDATLPSHWQRNRIWGGTTTTAYRDTTGSLSGSASLALFPGAGASADMFADAVPLVAGDVWALVFWAKSSDTNAGTSPGFYVRIRGGSTSTDVSLELYAGVENVAVPTSWTKYLLTFTIPSGMTWGGPMFLNYLSNTGHKISVDDVQFRKVIGATLIADGAITTAKLDAGAVTAAKITAGSITANEIASTLTWTKDLTISTGGKIKQGKTSASSTTAGFWLGDDGGSSYDFHIGNSTSYMWWDGSAGSLTVKGSVDLNQAETETTPTWTSGWSSAPTGKMHYRRSGNLVFVRCDGACYGTSNSGSFSFTIATPAPAAQRQMVVSVYNAGTLQPATLTINTDQTCGVVPYTGTANGFSGSGNKGFTPGSVFVYSLD